VEDRSVVDVLNRIDQRLARLDVDLLLRLEAKLDVLLRVESKLDKLIQLGLLDDSHLPSGSIHKH
jgi:hypothetical protein